MYGPRCRPPALWSSARQGFHRRLGLANALQHRFAPKLSVFCGIHLSKFEADAALVDDSEGYKMVMFEFLTHSCRRPRWNEYSIKHAQSLKIVTDSRTLNVFPMLIGA